MKHKENEESPIVALALKFRSMEWISKMRAASELCAEQNTDGMFNQVWKAARSFLQPEDAFLRVELLIGSVVWMPNVEINIIHRSLFACWK